MKKIIDPIPRDILEAELTSDKFIRETNNASNEIYTISHHDSPNLMKEIARLREISFRESGGGTGEEIDIDFFDTKENPYKQLIVWDPEEKEIIGGYRYFDCNASTCIREGFVDLSTAHLFNFSDKFINEYLPYTIELGRSFVQPMYQSRQMGKKALFALDNLWDGLGSLIIDNPNIKYFFGKITMYPSFNHEARDYILYFLHKYFEDKQDMVVPINSLQYHGDLDIIKKELSADNYKDDYKTLTQKVRSLGVNIPPLFNSYMNLSSSMLSFGTAINTEFGDVEETGIMITIKDVYEAKSKRHVESYIKQ